MDGDTPGPSRWAAEAEWMSLLGRVTALEPYSDGHPEGTRAASKLVQDLLDARGFETRVIDQDGRDGAGIVVASRPPRGGAGNGLWVGLFGHVDIERIDQEDTGRTWRTDDPLVPTVVVAAASESAPDVAPPRDRLYCRGVGDNLGPLLQRILCLSDDDNESPGLLFILHGEEEIGSPWAHEQYPLLVGDGDGHEPLIDNVALWLEETGYFLANGDQRILNVNTGTDNPITPAGLQAAILGAVRDEAAADGRGTTTLDRPLTKAFGVEKCPCLTHLLTGRPAMYLAIGPNDVDTHIHEPDESIPMDTLDISARQFRGVLTAVASWEP